MKKTKRLPKSSAGRLSALRDSTAERHPAIQFPSQPLFDSTAFGFAETDLDGRIRQCNATLARMLLANQADCTRSSLFNFLPEKWHEKEAATRAEVLKSGVTDEYQVELRKKDGGVFSVVIKKWLQFDERDKTQKIWLLVRDASNKKPQSDAMFQRAVLFVESQVRYQALLARVPVGVVTIDKLGRIETINPAAEELLGYRSAEIIGKNLREFVTSGNEQQLPIAASQAHVTIARCYDGKVLSTQITTDPSRAQGPELYTCFLRDITTDVQAREAIERFQEVELRLREDSEEIARLNDALQTEINERARAQEQFQVAVESAPNGVLIANKDGKIALVNAQIEQQFGYDRGELIGQPIEYLLPERFRNRHIHHRDSFFASPNIRLTDKEGELYGLRKDGREFPMELSLNPIQTPGGKGVLVTVIDSTERKRVESELKQTAFHDGLTGLPNRTLFLDNLLRLNAASKRHGHHPFALLFLDLDRFKVINDSLGHIAGDKFLIETAHRLVECTREEDTVARLGGDEFAVLLEQIRGPEDAVRVARRALERLAEPMMLDDNEVSVGVSIGIALSMTGEKNPENLLRDADMAMYQAKTRRSGYQIFDARMHARALERMRLEIDMKRAIEREQIHLHYQPIVSLGSGNLAGFEALARWHHNGRGAVSPTQFIPLAEETGLVGPLSSWVFREACRQMRRWQEKYAVNDDCFISVNVSSKQVSHGKLIEEIDDVLHETGLEPQRLRLEITESAIVENTRLAAHTLSQLKKRRIKLCLDDFGRGFSSLNYLHRFPIDVLKIDRSFVRRLGTDLTNDHGRRRPYEIIRTILALAQILGIEVVAEGVEIAPQLDLLRGLGCEMGQGFLFAPALNADEAARFFDPSTSRLQLSASTHRLSEPSMG